MAQPLRKVLEDPDVVRGLQENPGTYRFKNGAFLEVSAVHWPPHIVVEEAVGGGGELTVGGPMADLLTTLADSLNFTYKIVQPGDRAWGAKLPNGTWSGMVGQVSRQEVDIALGPFGISEARFKVVDYTSSFYYDDRSILAMKGLPEVDPWGFLYPFTPLVWAALVAALLVACLAVVVLGSRPKTWTHLSWVSQLLFLHFRIVLLQDLSMKTSSGRERLVVGGWMVVAMMLMWSYSGTLISLLAVRHVPQPLQSIRDAVQDSSVTVIMTPNTVVTDIISKIKSGDLKDLNDLKYVGRVLYQLAKDNPHSMNTHVRHQRHVIIGPTLSADLLIANLFAKTGKCDFYKARQTFFTTHHCMIGQKGNPIVPAMSHRLRGLVESGVYEHWLFNSIPFMTSCRLSPSKITVKEALTLKSLWGTVVLLAAGLLLAFASFCLELFLANYVFV
ncbi:probable glutamate receptor [Homarus americanus]|uniref:probable glutamate receptor n=1 Tax=Homarus americanus TaxID=6706 RepID=UPI001C49571E|nr:probable glutamate receptor [Homarus americanus]